MFNFVSLVGRFDCNDRNQISSYKKSNAHKVVTHPLESWAKEKLRPFYSQIQGTITFKWSNELHAYVTYTHLLTRYN